MTIKQIKMNDEFKEKMKKGIDIVADSVGITLGPKGRNVIIDNNYKQPTITNDGVTIAKKIELKDPFENLGAKIIKMAAENTQNVSGDGTTTSTILARRIIELGWKYLYDNNANPVKLNRELNNVLNMVLSKIDSIKEKIKDDNDIINIASISANNDREIGKLISDALKISGVDGVINVEESRTNETSIDAVEGVTIEKGMLSPYFITDQYKLNCVLNDVYILIYAGKINNIKEISSILNVVSGNKKSILIMADDVSAEVLSALIVNKSRDVLKVAAIKNPGFGSSKMDTLNDIAVLTGGKVVDENTGFKLENMKMELLGRADKVIVGADETIIQGSHGSEEEIENLIGVIKSQIKNIETSDYEREILLKRLTKLNDGVTVIRIGATSELESNEKKMRIDDAIHATKAAIEDGIVPGGGSIFVHITKFIENELKTIDYNDFEKRVAHVIMKDSLLEPISIIVKNSGGEIGEVISKVKDKEIPFGYNALTNEYGNMFEMGVIDSAKVIKTSLKNAVNVAGIFLTTDVAIVDDKEELEKQYARLAAMQQYE